MESKLNIQFPSELFNWIKQECGNVSPASFVVKTMEEKRKGSERGAKNDRDEGCGLSASNRSK